MNRLMLILLLLIFSSDLIKSQRTDEYGDLLRINYMDANLDTSSIGSWTKVNGSYEGHEFWSHSEYYKVFDYNGDTYGLIHNSEWSLLSGFGLELEKLENSDRVDYFHTYGEYDIISPFTIFNSNILNGNNGVYLLNGEIQQCYIEFGDYYYIKHALTFNALNAQSIILGLLDDKLLIVSSETEGYNFYLCSVDSSYTISPVKPIYVELPLIDGLEVFPNFVYRLNDDFYLGNTNNNVTFIYQHTPDSLVINSVVYSNKVYGYKNTIYYWEDQKLFKTQFDSLSGSYNQKIELLNGLYWDDLAFPESGSSITYWNGDAIFVYDLQTEKNVFQLGLYRDNNLSNAPLIDSPYVYLHKTVKITYLKQSDPIPNKFYLSQNYPNPFNPTTTIEYTIPNRSTEYYSLLQVELKVYDVLGCEITTLVNETQPAGSYSITFNASKLSSGIYIYKLQAGKYTTTRKLMLLK